MIIYNDIEYTYIYIYGSNSQGYEHNSNDYHLNDTDIGNHPLSRDKLGGVTAEQVE